jgi:hypothetical protein
MPDSNRDRDDGYDPDRWDAAFIIARDGPRKLEDGVYRRTLASLNNGWLARGGHLRLHDDHLSFTPSPFERLLFARHLNISFENIEVVERDPKSRDAVLPGGKAPRMRLRGREGRDFEFVFTAGLDDWIAALEERMGIWERRQRFA